MYNAGDQTSSRKDYHSEDDDRIWIEGTECFWRKDNSNHRILFAVEGNKLTWYDSSDKIDAGESQYNLYEYTTHPDVPISTEKIGHYAYFALG
jgi:hypothetical protein